MIPHYETEHATLWLGDCIEVMRHIPDCSVDSIVTDPPYGLSDPKHVADALIRWIANDEREFVPDAGGFMGKSWDAFVPPPAVWDECLRVLKPGGHLLAFAGTRTMDLMSLSIRLAGFEIRDSIAWLYGSGFPKSLDVSKAIDKAAGAERRVVGSAVNGVRGMDAMNLAQGKRGKMYQEADTYDVTAPATPDAEKWQGWGTALKPAFEPVVVGRKPLSGTVAANVLAHGTGALNIDATRVAHASETDRASARPQGRVTSRPGSLAGKAQREEGDRVEVEWEQAAGRWPSNVLLDESQAAALDKQTGTLTSGTLAAHHARAPKDAGILGAYGSAEGERGYGDSGGASRFFPTFRYEAKAPTKERPTGIDEQGNAVAHPTVKPVELMRWLCRLVTPPGGTILEPFAGSGTTVEAALTEGFHIIAIEREADYMPLIEARMVRPMNGGLFSEDEL